MRSRLIVPTLMIFFGLLLLPIIIPKSNSIPLLYQFSYFCCGGLFGVGISLLSFKAENLTRINAERITKDFVKLMLISIIILSPVYVIPLYYIYSASDGFLLLLLYIAGCLLIGGVTSLILNIQKRDMPEPTNELKSISKFFIIIATSLVLIAAGCGTIYAFYSIYYTILGIILIFFGLMFLIYIKKVKAGIVV